MIAFILSNEMANSKRKSKLFGDPGWKVLRLNFGSRPEVKVSWNGPERRPGKRIMAGTAFR